MNLYFCENCMCKDYCLCREPTCACCALYNIDKSKEICSLDKNAGFVEYICEDAMPITFKDNCKNCCIDECKNRN